MRTFARLAFRGRDKLQTRFAGSIAPLIGFDLNFPQNDITWFLLEKVQGATDN